MSALVIVVAVAAGPAAPAQARRHASSLVTYRLSVTYSAPVCGTPRSQPLDSAPLVFLRHGTRVAHAAAALSQAGRASVRLGREPVVAYARLDDGKIDVRARGLDKAFLPDVLHTGSAYIKLGVLHPGANAVEISEASDRRAANAWSQLQKNRRFAAPLSPKALKPFFVALDSRDKNASYDVPARRLTLTTAGAFANLGAIAHEFGHYVMFENISEAPGQDGTHYFPDSFPDQPGMAFYEGWAWAYAAAEQNTSRLTLDQDCGTFVDLTADPSHLTFPITQPHYAQFSEEAAAYVIYALAGYLGDGSVTKGLAVIASAYERQQVNGRDPETMRDLRDVLIEDGLEQGSKDRDDAINEIFARYGMQWGIELRLYPDSSSDAGSLAFNSTTMTVTGPSGFQCHENVDQNLAPLGDAYGSGHIGSGLGPLGYTFVDDCIIDGGPDEGDQNTPGAYQRGFPDGYVALPMPYLQGGAEQRGTYTISVQFTCHAAVEDGVTDDRARQLACAQAWVGDLRIAWLAGPPSGQFLSIDPASPDQPSDDADGDIIRRNLTIPIGTPTPVVTFDAAGRHCTIDVTGSPCYSGPGPTS
jgi:hypothetical protein